jgi:hypothetical protein
MTPEIPAVNVLSIVTMTDMSEYWKVLLISDKKRAIEHFCNIFI